jgi:hypothetical protein
VREFSRVRLAGTERRTIAILSREGDRPALAIARWEGQRQTGRILIRRPELAALEDALRWARDPFLAGRHGTGAIDYGGGLRCLVWAHRDDARGRAPAVVLATVRDDGSHVGRPTTIGGAELDGLALAATAFRALVSPDRGDERP